MTWVNLAKIRSCLSTTQSPSTVPHFTQSKSHGVCNGPQAAITDGPCFASLFPSYSLLLFSFHCLVSFPKEQKCAFFSTSSFQLQMKVSKLNRIHLFRSAERIYPAKQVKHAAYAWYKKKVSQEITKNVGNNCPCFHYPMTNTILEYFYRGPFFLFCFSGVWVCEHIFSSW